MVFCAAYGCVSRQKKGSGLSFFSFPKEGVRRKTWVIYCRREDFVPSKNSRLCSLHFSKEQLDRDPDKLLENGYVGAKIRLRTDAVPDTPLPLHRAQDKNAAIVLPSRKPRGAYEKRQRTEVLRQVLQEMESRNQEQPPTDQDDTRQDDEQPPTACTEQNDPPSADEETGTSIQTDSTEKTNKKCQAAIQPPQRTRRIQVSLTNEKTVKTVSTGVQCSTLSDDVPLRVAAGLVTQHVPPQPPESESEEEDDDDRDPDFDPLDVAEDNDEDLQHGIYPLRTNAPPEEERQFLVSESSLAKLLGKCDSCDEECHPVVQYTRGTMIGTVSTCSNGHVMQWESQKCHHGMPWSNLLVAGSIVFSGINTSKCLRFFRHLKVPTISASTFSRIQSAYVVPAALFMWDFHQAELLSQYEGRNLTLGGDARCDSLGFSAKFDSLGFSVKFGSYTLMDLAMGKVVDFQLVQSNEVAGSKHMELEGLKRGLRRIEDAGLHVQTLVTDRHGMVKKFMRTEHQEKKHYFDVWYMAKVIICTGISKKLKANAKKKDCEDIRLWTKSVVNHCYWVAASNRDNGDMKEEKWASLVEHVANKQENCQHGELDEDRQWLREGSRAHKLFREVVENKFLLKDVSKLSPLHQTYSLEVFHSVVNSFAPKTTHFFYPAMMARLCVAALHFNENGRRHQAMTRDGAPQWQLSYPNGKKGTHAVVKPHKTPITYDYIDILRLNLVERRLQIPSCPAASSDGKAFLGYQPPPLTSSYAAVNKDQLIT